MPKANWLDNLIGYVAPEKAARRVRARFAFETIQDILGRRYEGASRGRRTEGWHTPDTSANAEIGGSLSRLRSRARDLVRNNGYASRGLQVITSNVVGTGIIPQILGPSDKKAQQVRDAWKKWGETTECDADGRHDFYGIQSLAMRTIAESGEVLIRRRRRRPDDPLSIPLQLQVLEGDFIDTSKEGPTNSGGFILQGIEFDQLGRRVAYWIFDQHPGETSYVFGRALTSHRVDASEICHRFRMDRANQIRGVTWFAPIILKLRDFDEYEDAQLIRQKIAACFVAFVHDAEGGQELTTQDRELSEKCEPGLIELLPNNKDVTFGNPPTVQGYGEYAGVSLHGIAAGIGVPYEMFTGDFSKVNFSSARMGFLQFQRDIDLWRWHLMIPGICQPVASWFMEAATLKGVDTSDIYFGWTPPRREMIDPTREVPARRDAIRSGLISFSESARESGYEPLDLLQEMKADAELLDKFGLVLDCDPRRINKSGALQGAAADEAPEEETKSEEDEEW